MSGSPRSAESPLSRVVMAGRGQLAPVGEPIVFGGQPAGGPGWQREEYRYLLLNSGTAALALALALAGERMGRPAGEVILPAYGCPDLLAAAHHAGLVPVLADLHADRPRYDLAALEALICERTAAVVAVNFLGIPEDLAALRTLCDRRGVLLIEDDAQYFPLGMAPYQGDLIVHSFGRGKPVSQLGGGAVLARGALGERLLDAGRSLPVESLSPAAWRVKAQLFNLVLHPLGYQALLLLPFLDVGRTVYKPLRQLACMPGWRRRYLDANIAAYQQRQRPAQQQIDAVLQRQAPSINLPRAMDALEGPLLRYPLLCGSAAQSDALYRQLRRRGLGVTRMYQRPLPEIEGIPERLAGHFPGAASFAARLLTIPTSSFVGQRHLASLEQALAACSIV